MNKSSTRGSGSGRRNLLVALGLAGVMVATTLVNEALPASVAEAAPETFVELPPTRLVDTRPGSPTPGVIDVPTVKLTPGVPLAVPMAGAGGLPSSGAAAYNLNVTATEASRRGNIAVFPCAAGFPGPSNLNYQAATSPSRTQIPPSSMSPVISRSRSSIALGS